MEYTGELYQFSSVYRHLVLNKDAVIRRRFDKRSAKSHYLRSVVLFDISKDSDVLHSHELTPRDVTDQYQDTNAEERIREWRVKGGRGRSGVAARRQNWGTHVYGDPLPSKSARSADTVNVVFTISGYQEGGGQ